MKDDTFTLEKYVGSSFLQHFRAHSSYEFKQLILSDSVLKFSIFRSPNWLNVA